jgi:hypothetical protein
MKGESEKKELTSQRIGNRGILLILITMGSTSWLATYIATNFFGIRPGISMYFGFRVLISLIIGISFLPSSILGEIISSRRMNRKFRSKSVIAFSAFLGEFLLVFLFLSFLLEFFLPSIDQLILLPLIATILSVAMVTPFLTMRVPPIRRILKKAWL